jgi:hypothetical protein
MKTPPDILDKFEKATQGVDYGTITLSLFIKHGRPRYVIAREESYIPTDESSLNADSCVNEEHKDNIKHGGHCGIGFPYVN